MNDKIINETINDNIDLNSMFNFTFNFDKLKNIITYLLNAEKTLKTNIDACLKNIKIININKNSIKDSIVFKSYNDEDISEIKNLENDVEYEKLNLDINDNQSNEYVSWLNVFYY